MPKLPSIDIDFNAKIKRALADLAILEEAVKRVERVTARQNMMEAIKARRKNLGTSMLTDALKELNKQAENGGAQAGDSFWVGFRKEMRKGARLQRMQRGPFGRLMGWMGAALPAAAPLGGGLLGILGGLGAAAAGAATGLLALKMSATEVLTPVKSAFQALDQYASASGKSAAGLIQANASILRTWLNSSAGTVKVGKGTAPASPAAIAAAQLRLQAALARAGGQGSVNPATLARYRLDIQSEQGYIAANQARLAQYRADLAAAKTPAERARFQADILATTNRISGEQGRIGIYQQDIAGLGNVSSSSRLGAQASIISARARLAALMGRGGPGVTTITPHSLNVPGVGNMGFLTNPNINWYTMTAKQRRMVVLASQMKPSDTGLPPAGRAQISALMNERQIYSSLNPGQQRALFRTIQFDKAKTAAEAASQKPILGLYGNLMRVGTMLLPQIPFLTQIATGALNPLVNRVGRAVRSPAGATLFGNLGRMAKLGISGFGTGALNIGGGLANILNGLIKAGIPHTVMTDFVQMTKAFQNWTGGSGFQKFMDYLKKNTPLVDDLLRNLQHILVKLFAGLGGTIGQSELHIIAGFVSLLSHLVNIPGFAGFLANMIALHLILARFGAVRAEGWAIGKLGQLLLKQVPGIDVVDGKITGVGDKLKGLGTKVGGWLKPAGTAILNLGKAAWTTALSFGKAAVSAIKSAVLWSVQVIATAVKTAAAWIAEQAAMVAATIAANASIIAATGGVALAIGLIVLAIVEIVKHWKAVSTFWRNHPLLVHTIAILFGPIGILLSLIMDIATHWNTVKHVVEDVIIFILGIISHFLHGLQDVVNFAAKMPGPLGAPFRAMQKPLQGAIDKVDGLRKAMENLRNKNVLVHVSPKGSWSISRTGTGGLGGGMLHAAAGLLIPGRDSGRDDRLVLARGGELMVPPEMVKAGLVDHLRGKIPGFAAGGIIPRYGGSLGGLGGWTRHDELATEKVFESQVATVAARQMRAIMTAQKKGFSRAGFGVPGPGGGSAAANAALARRMMPAWGTGAEWAAWNYVAMRESGWNQYARNPSSGAYGIPQALPPSKMGPAANPPQSNPHAQIAWMIGYISGRYGDPIGAANHERAFNWYDNGGYLLPGFTAAVNRTGTRERILNPWETRVWDSMTRMRVHSGSRPGSDRPVIVNVYTSEINPRYHAAQLGFELARRSG